MPRPKTFEPGSLKCSWEPGWNCRDPTKEDEETKGMTQREYYWWEQTKKITTGFDALDGLVVKHAGSYDCTERSAPDIKSSDLTVHCPIIEVNAPKGKIISCVETPINDRYKKISCKAK